MALKAALKIRLLNGWQLFWLVSLPISALVVWEMLATDLTTGAGVSHMIGYAVRFAIPLIFIVTAASALHTLFPGSLTAWLLRNRKYIGLCFAVAMGWQGAFILMMSFLHNDYYYTDIYILRDELEGSVGYLFLTAMVITSFRFGRQRLSPQQWRLLHVSGVYFLWAYPFSTYWWTVVGYYGEFTAFDWALYVMGFLAFAARIAAWGKRRLQRIAKDESVNVPTLPQSILGGVLIGLGVYLGATAAYWQHAVSGALLSELWSARLNLWLPYWPFEPFLPLAIIGLGTWLATRARPQPQGAAVAI